MLVQLGQIMDKKIQKTKNPTAASEEPGAKAGYWASLVVQWLRIRLPMQGTRVRALVWEGPTCRGATRPVSHNC